VVTVYKIGNGPTNHPGITKNQIAARLGISTSRLRAVYAAAPAAA
jgi:hypothetical protein